MLDGFEELPLFPLHTVLFPGGELSLCIFEMRYRRLVDMCGKQRPFAVVRIRAGGEVGEPAFTYEVGTRVFFKHLLSQRDGVLGALVFGEHRVRLSEWRVDADGLMFARAHQMVEEVFEAIPDDLKSIAASMEMQGHAIPDAGILAWRLADGLPLNANTRQALLEESDAALRLNSVRDWLVRYPGWFAA